MRYLSMSYSQSDNLGDEIQSLAAEQFLPRVDGFVDRDTGLHEVREPSTVILNGWFKYRPDCWPPSDAVRPVFFGFHIGDVALVADRFLDYYKRWEPIGCRDRGTADMLTSRGIAARVTGCLSLTFPPRTESPSRGRMYIVEGGESVGIAVPEHLAADAVRRNHYTCFTMQRKDQTNDIKRAMALDLLAEYRAYAGLVVTNLLHCALPCTAMGIPVVFVLPHDKDYPNNYRADPARAHLRAHVRGDEVDWNPRPPDVAAAAEAMRAAVRGLVP